MAKQWFYYQISTTTLAAQITPQNYEAIGAYVEGCSLADRTCLIYTYTSSGAVALPSPVRGGAPAISAKLQSYMALNITGPIVDRPVGSKKYLYVRGG